MPQKTLPLAANASQRKQPDQRTKRMETNDTTTAFIQDFPGLRVTLVGANQVEEFVGDDSLWRQKQAEVRALRGRQPDRETGK